MQGSVTVTLLFLLGSRIAAFAEVEEVLVDDSCGDDEGECSVSLLQLRGAKTQVAEASGDEIADDEGEPEEGEINNQDENEELDEDVHALADVDGDGEVSHSEALGFVDGLRTQSQEESLALFQAQDADSSEGLNGEEFGAALEAWGGGCSTRHVNSYCSGSHRTCCCHEGYNWHSCSCSGGHYNSCGGGGGGYGGYRRRYYGGGSYYGGGHYYGGGGSAYHHSSHYGAGGHYSSSYHGHYLVQTEAVKAQAAEASGDEVADVKGEPEESKLDNQDQAEELVEDVHALADVDGDGEVSHSEALGFVEGLRNHSNEESLALFQAQDADSSEGLNGEEFGAALEVWGGGCSTRHVNSYCSGSHRTCCAHEGYNWHSVSCSGGHYSSCGGGGGGYGGYRRRYYGGGSTYHHSSNYGGAGGHYSSSYHGHYYR